MKIEDKIKTLINEKETIIAEMNELQKAFMLRQERILEINGSLKTLQELLDEETKEKTEETEK